MLLKEKFYTFASGRSTVTFAFQLKDDTVTQSPTFVIRTGARAAKPRRLTLLLNSLKRQNNSIMRLIVDGDSSVYARIQTEVPI